jgi:hypothetical protein
MTLFRRTLLPKTKAPGPSATQSAQQSTVGGPTGYRTLAPSHYQAYVHSQSASTYDDPNTPYPPGHPLAPEGSRDQCGGWGVKPDDETTVAALLTGLDASGAKVGGSKLDGKKN